MQRPVTITPLEKKAQQLSQDFKMHFDNLQDVSSDHGENTIYAADMGQEKVIIRIRKNTEWNPFPLEVWAYNQFKKYAIPAPDVIAYQESPKRIGSPTLILKRIPGKTVGEKKLGILQEGELFEQAGMILNKIHQIPVVGFGFLHINDAYAKGDTESWKSHWERRGKPEHFQQLVKEHIITKKECRILLDLYYEVIELPVKTPSFLHNDYHARNMITDGKRITGVIDLSNSFSGDYRYDIATALFFQTSFQQKVFIKGYGKGAEDPIIKKYLIVVSGIKVAGRYYRGHFTGTQRALQTFKAYIKPLL